MQIIKYDELEKDTKKLLKKAALIYVLRSALCIVNAIALWCVANYLFVIVDDRYWQSSLASFLFSFISTIYLANLFKGNLAEIKTDLAHKVISILHK